MRRVLVFAAETVMAAFSDVLRSVWEGARNRSGPERQCIEGASDRPVYLLIQDGKAEIKDAAFSYNFV